ncbi:hypothetical protein ACFVWG_33420 [Kribbella sp. NPDC058245]|uniref:hypothetical protein n=1 Tax=Kribbella sp. NPDC058245 TaxID=3346399 RepID=UPI0036EA877B
MWRRVRQYAVPPSMIETAAVRRSVGDWAGACAAARIDVDLDLRAVRDRHGTEVVNLLRTDLRRLAPDLLRWHMPRIAPDGLLRPGVTVSLSRYPGMQLVVRTPPAWADAGQRMSLALWEVGAPSNHPHPSRRFRLDLHRHLWDSTRYGELARRCGVGRAAWAVEAELLLGHRSGFFTVRLNARSHAVLELVAPDNSHAPTIRSSARPEVAQLPMLPDAAVRVLPDLELLQAGLITSERLHPLVAAALPMTDSVAATTASGSDPHRVECRGEIHRIVLRDGVLAAVDHDAVELRREELLVALGGPALPCLQAIDAVHRDPEDLPAVRERIDHGDFAGALDVIERLLGPGAILRDGPLREELESAAARRVDHGLFRADLRFAGRAFNSRYASGSFDRRTRATLRPKRISRVRRRTDLS